MPSLQTALHQRGLVKTDDPRLHEELRLRERFAELQPQWVKLNFFTKCDYIEKLRDAEFSQQRRVGILGEIIEVLEKI